MVSSNSPKSTVIFRFVKQLLSQFFDRSSIVVIRNIESSQIIICEMVFILYRRCLRLGLSQNSSVLCMRGTH